MDQLTNASPPARPARRALWRPFLVAVALSLLMAANAPVPAHAATVVRFADSHLEAVVRSALGKPTGDITDADMLTLTSLDASYQLYLRDLDGLQYARNLTTLHLRVTGISDIGPLSGLTKLTVLDLQGSSFPDFRVDLFPRVSDITPLEGLTELEYLDVSHNRVSDLSPIAAASNLSTLAADYDYLALTPGSPAVATIRALRSRGVHVTYLPQWTALTRSPTAASVVRHHGVAVVDFTARLTSKAGTSLGSGHLLSILHSSTGHLPYWRVRGSSVRTGSDGRATVRMTFTKPGRGYFKWAFGTTETYTEAHSDPTLLIVR